MSGPLDFSLPTGTTKTAIPRLVPDTYVKVRLAGIRSESGEKGKTLHFDWQLVDPTPNADGGTIMPGQLGSKIFDTLYLYGKDGEEAAKVRATEKVSKILDGLLGTADPDNKKGKQPRPEFTPELAPTLYGLTTLIKVRDPKGDRTQQDIVSYTFPGDVAGAM